MVFWASEQECTILWPTFYSRFLLSIDWRNLQGGDKSSGSPLTANLAT